MTAWATRKQFTEVSVDGVTRRMAHVEQGDGPPVLLLHGNPTSSFLWRDVMAELPRSVRAVAPDLIGQGDSEKLPDSGPERYRFVEHRAWLDALLDRILPPERDGPGVVLVIHDWGSALGFDWARRNAHRVRGIAYMEGIVRPMSWEEWPEAIRDLFRAFRSEAGEAMALEKNIFVERVLPGSILRALSEEEMAEYRRPFASPGEDRRPTLTWPRQIPLGGEPADVCAIAAAYYAWLQTAEVPKLLVAAEPGAILTGPMLADARALPHQTEATVAGSHFIQEDSGAEIGRAVSAWMGAL